MAFNLALVSILLKTVLQMLSIKKRVFLLVFHLLSLVKILVHNSVKGTSFKRPYLKNKSQIFKENPLGKKGFYT